MLFTIKSYAKLNLFLNINGQRKDGYHLLFSLMSYIDLYDIIRLSPNNTQSPTLMIKGAFGNYFDNLSSNALDSNSVIVALRYMYRKYHINAGFDIVLHKNIPLASGMGGGSSNAASIICFCNDYFDLGLTGEEMMRDAQCIGSDVPFFINDHMAICRGIGEVVTPVKLDADNIEVILINPMLPLKTPRIYNGFDLATCQSSENDFSEGFWDDFQDKGAVMSKRGLFDMMQHYSNDLTASATKIVSRIVDVLQTLKTLPGLLLPRMSGSGATCFALCCNEVSAANAVYALKARYPLAFVGRFQLLSQIDRSHFAPSAAPCFQREFSALNMVA